MQSLDHFALLWTQKPFQNTSNLKEAVGSNLKGKVGLGITDENNDSRINNEDAILMALAGLKQVNSLCIIYLQGS